MGELEIKSYSNEAAPLYAHEQTVMVKVTAPVTAKAPLDIVFVLDTSWSMSGDRIAKMKKATMIAIEKLKPRDKFAIVPFSSDVNMNRASLLNATSEVKKQSEAFVDGLHAHGNTNMKGGLDVAVKIMLGRGAAQDGRTSVIFLMSDGEQNYGDARSVPQLSKVNIETFGFGEAHDPKLLSDVAAQSHGGAFHLVTDAEDANHLAQAFALVLGGFRDISILNLRVTLRQQGTTTIRAVEAGAYPMEQAGGSFTVDFRDLARSEDRRIMVFLGLPAVPNEEQAKTVMTVECSYRLVVHRTDTVGQKHEVAMKRSADADPAERDPQVPRELLRRGHATSLQEAMNLAEKKDFDGASEIVAERMNILANANESTPHDVVDALSMEMDDMFDNLGSEEQYAKIGKASVLAAISSHARQRPTARGDVNDNTLFATERMKKYVAHAKEEQS